MSNDSDEDSDQEAAADLEVEQVRTAGSRHCRFVFLTGCNRAATRRSVQCLIYHLNK